MALSSNIKTDYSGNTILCKAIKTGYTPGLANTVPESFATVKAGATLTLNPDDHQGVIVLFDQATGSQITLPSATGSGNYYDCLVGTAVTSNNHVFKTNGTDTLVGTLTVGSTATSALVGLQSTNKTLTFSTTTTGGQKGGWIHAVDIAANVWYVEANMIGTGTAAVGVS